MKLSLVLCLQAVFQSYKRSYGRLRLLASFVPGHPAAVGAPLRRLCVINAVHGLKTRR